jgi:hypothetical protein
MTIPADNFCTINCILSNDGMAGHDQLQGMMKKDDVI